MFTHPKIGVGVVILDPLRQSILLILRKKEPEVNTWSIPGGKVELFETMEHAAIREIKEEVGLDIQIQSLFCTAETITESEHWISVIYLAVPVTQSPQIMEPDAITDMKWFSVHDLPSPLSCFSIPAIEKLKRPF